MIVQAVNGCFYRKPMWYGVFQNNRWLVNFNSNEELELSIEVDKKSTTRIGERAYKIMDEWKVKFKIGVFDPIGIFPPDWESVKRYKYLLELLDFPPIPSSCEVILDDVSLSELKYCFDVPFPIIDIWQYFEKKPHRLSGDLCDYLVSGFNSPWHKKAMVRSRLRKQFPDMARLNLIEATAKYGSKPRVSKNGTESRIGKSQGSQP